MSPGLAAVLATDTTPKLTGKCSVLVNKSAGLIDRKPVLTGKWPMLINPRPVLIDTVSVLIDKRPMSVRFLCKNPIKHGF